MELWPNSMVYKVDMTHLEHSYMHVLFHTSYDCNVLLLHQIFAVFIYQLLLRLRFGR